CSRPRSRVSAGIVDGRLVVEGHQIGTRKAFDDMKLVGMWITIAIDPGSFIESHHVDHKSIALPMTNRMAGPRRGQLISLGMRTPVHIDIAPDVCAAFIDDQDSFFFRKLNELKRKGRCHGTRSARWKAKSFGIVSGEGS